MAPTLNRRRFLQAAGSLAAFTAASPFASAVAVPQNFAFVASLNGGGLHTFVQNSSSAWTLTHTLPSESPTALALSPNRRVLYVANALRRFDPHPAGSIHAFAIHPVSGHLRLINRRPLALFATAPTSLAISPGARWLAAGIGPAAWYNLLPLAPDGSLGPLTASFRKLNVAPCPESIHFPDDTTLLSVHAATGMPIAAYTVGETGSLAQLSAPVPPHRLSKPPEALPTLLTEAIARAAIGPTATVLAPDAA